MAPKSLIEVRSESWLNLTDEREREEVLIKELKKKYPRQVNSVSRHSIGSWQHLEANETAKAAASQSSTLSSSNNNNKNGHLLIRLRQQSYLNRSSNSLSSNLSNSIDLTPSLIGNLPQQREEIVHYIPTALEDEEDSHSSARTKGNSDVVKQLDEQGSKLVKTKNSVLKEEPRRLKYLKSKLQNKGKRIEGNNNKELNQAGESPSLMRSLSSFSEKLNGKLGNFRHSWKHFLYNYNQQQQKQEEEEEEKVDYHHNLEAMKSRLDIRNTTKPSIENIANKRFSECQEINKRQLTHDWLERYHKSTAGSEGTQRSEMRPKSVEIIQQHIEEQLSLNKFNHRQEKEQQDLYLLSRESKQRKNVFRENSGIINNNFVATVNETKNNYLTPDNQQLFNSSKASNEFLSPNNHNNITTHRTSRDTPSSTTLVTALTTSNNNSFSASSSTTCLESLSSNLTLNSNFNQQDQQQDISTTKQLISTPEMNAKNNNLSAFNLSAKHSIQDNGELVFPTSDYWSTVASNDCYKQQPVGIENIQLINTQQPMLVADQEYYLDVANAAVLSGAPPFEPILVANQQQQQQSQPALLNDSHIPSFVNVTSIPTTTITTPQQITPPNKQINLQQQQQHLLNLPPAMDEDYDDYAVPADESCHLDRSQVELIQMIGEGQKGYVFLGKLQSKDGNSIQDVAIKTLKYETEELIDKLMREAAMMRQFEHPHIIKFIGVCPETPALIAMELAEFGEIKQYLKLNKQLIQVSQLILFTFQISTALSYLESKQYVHRDVAARNVLVCSHNCVKLADFGLSRNLSSQQQTKLEQNSNNNNKWINSHSNLSHRLLTDNSPDKSHYVAVSKGKLPVRWLAPESLAFRRFTSASDVWMFAVCSWELFHYGQLRPWAQIRNNQVLMAIESGQRLAKPPNCPLRLYQLMLQCWSYAPIQRPKFRELKQSLWSIYLNEKAREQIELEQQQELKELEEKRQNQERLILLMNKQQQQQQQQQQQRLILEEQQQRNLQEVLSNQQNQFMMMRQHQQRINSMSPISPVTTTSYATGNASGYSSTTATTADHSNNSSRSSSMGSLARSKAKLAARSSQQQQQQQRQPLAMLASSSGNNNNNNSSNKNNLFQLNMTDFNHQVAPPLPLINEQQQQQQQVYLANEAKKLSAAVKEKRDKKMVEANMRRFQRVPGYVLQKQRSQGSIITSDYNLNDFDSRRNEFVAQSNNQQSKSKNHHQQYHQSGFDDCALLVSSARDRQIKRQLISELQIRIDKGNDDEDDDDDNDDDDDDSSSETETTTAVNVRKLVGNMERMSLTSQMRTPEPAYEGLQQVLISRQQQQQPQVVGSRPDSCSATNWPLQEHNNRQQQQQQQQLLTPTPITRHYVQDGHQFSPGKRSRERVSEPKVSDILQSFKISPLKAKLTYNRQGSVVEARPGSELLVGQKDRKNIVGQVDVEEEERQRQRQQEQLQLQQQQLALHQRLLGHIRPASSCKSRRSANLTNSQQQSKSPTDQVTTTKTSQLQQASKKVETVDQSLQILESLITMDDSAKVTGRKSATASPVGHNSNNKGYTTDKNSKPEERSKNSRYKQCSMAAAHAKLLGLATPNLHNYSPDT